MSAGFYSIQRIEQDAEGLHLHLDDSKSARLPRSHSDYADLCALFSHLRSEAERYGIPRSTWLVVGANGDIEEVRLVGRGVPLSVTSDDEGNYWVVFPFSNSSLRLQPDHPRFREFEAYLLDSLKQETAVLFVVSSHDQSVLDDLRPGGCISEETHGGREHHVAGSF